MASATINDFVRSDSHADPLPFSLIEQKGLISRLSQELQAALTELARDPRGFARALLSGETDAKRRKRIYLGLSCAVIAHGALLSLIAVLGWHTMFAKPVEQDDIQYEVTTLRSTAADKVEVEPPKGAGKSSGGGGQQSVSPPSKGEPPRSLPQPPIVSPNPSNIPEPTLAVLPSVVGPEAPPPPPAPIGDPTGKGNEFSGGPGSKGGIGRGVGTGVGDGNNPGGPGTKGARDGGTPGSPDGTAPGIRDMTFNARKPSGFSTFAWIYRARAIITPEAQANKVVGTVLLLATFRADGTITDVEVVNPVPYMTESAIESLTRCKFRPATINGVPVTLRRVPVHINVHY